MSKIISAPSIDDIENTMAYFGYQDDEWDMLNIGVISKLIAAYRAVNCHDEAREALKSIADSLAEHAAILEHTGGGSWLRADEKKARAVLAKMTAP